jgi:hypothetical protein
MGHGYPLKYGKWFYRVIAAAAVSVLLSAAPPGAEAGCSKSVTMYNAWWCPYCRQVRAILARNHISYTILDATTPAGESNHAPTFWRYRSATHCSWRRCR